MGNEEDLYVTIVLVNNEGKKKDSKEGEIICELLTVAISVVVASYLLVCLPARMLLT